MTTKIEWTGETWNPIRARLRSDPAKVGWHCEHASPGCVNCYAETQNKARRWNLGTGLPYKPGHRDDVEIFVDEATLLKPLSWDKPRTVFVCSMTDIFADFVSDDMIDRIFAVMALCPKHTFQVLTKRSERMREYVNNPPPCEYPEVRIPMAIAKESLGYTALEGYTRWPLPNVWLGVSVEDMRRADERIPDLLDTPAAVRWLSCEPLLGPLDLGRWLEMGGLNTDLGLSNPGIDWLIAGGESGPGARPMHPDWVRSLRDQCAAADVPFFFKQWGEWAPALHDRENEAVLRQTETVGQFNSWTAPIYLQDTAADLVNWRRLGKKRAGRLLDGQMHDAMPKGGKTDG